jgi:hypothetical protein
MSLLRRPSCLDLVDIISQKLSSSPKVSSARPGAGLATGSVATRTFSGISIAEAWRNKVCDNLCWFSCTICQLAAVPQFTVETGERCEFVMLDIGDSRPPLVAPS